MSRGVVRNKTFISSTTIKDGTEVAVMTPVKIAQNSTGDYLYEYGPAGTFKTGVGISSKKEKKK